MTPNDQPEFDDPMIELRFALAEGDAVDASDALRQRVLSAAADARTPGVAVDAPERISGADAFRRAVVSLDELLGSLSGHEWLLPALRDLDVQGLIGHLIGVEEAFAAVLLGAEDLADHVEATQPAALRQRGTVPLETHRQWFDAATASIALLEDVDASAPVSFYGVTLPLDDVLVIRAFEMWIHDEDIRRATGRELSSPDPERLARMVGLVSMLLPAGIARSGHAQDGATARLVLTGNAGGTWDVNLDGTAEPRSATTRIVLDAAEFCRVVGNREDQVSSGAVVTGDATIAAGVLIGASALALD
jgi:uncharacterized protein (TIGR03083 family)